MALSDITKKLNVTSVLERSFDLFKALSGQLEQKTRNIMLNSEIVCVVFQQNTYSYKIELYTNSLQSLKNFVQNLYKKLTEDIVITLQKNPIASSQNDKKSALLDEISSKDANVEVHTDRVFLSK